MLWLHHWLVLEKWGSDVHSWMYHCLLCLEQRLRSQKKGSLGVPLFMLRWCLHPGPPWYPHLTRTLLLTGHMIQMTFLSVLLSSCGIPRSLCFSEFWVSKGSFNISEKQHEVFRFLWTHPLWIRLAAENQEFQWTYYTRTCSFPLRSPCYFHLIELDQLMEHFSPHIQ